MGCAKKDCNCNWCWIVVSGWATLSRGDPTTHCLWRGRRSEEKEWEVHRVFGQRWFVDLWRFHFTPVGRKVSPSIQGPSGATQVDYLVFLNKKKQLTGFWPWLDVCNVWSRRGSTPQVVRRVQQIACAWNSHIWCQFLSAALNYWPLPGALSETSCPDVCQKFVRSFFM